MRSVSIALCMAVLVIASVFVGAGTYAHYSGGTFTLDLSAPIEPVISSLNPGETIYIVIKIPNPSDTRITAQMRLTNVLCEENGIVEPEQEWYNLYGERNDIDTVITFGLWIDRDGNTSSCDAGDEWITEGHVDKIKDQFLDLGPIEPGQVLTAVTRYHMDPETGNWAQSDTMTFDLEFKREEIPVTPAGPTWLQPGYFAGILIVASAIAAGLLALRRRRGKMN